MKLILWHLQGSSEKSSEKLEGFWVIVCEWPVLARFKQTWFGMWPKPFWSVLFPFSSNQFRINSDYWLTDLITEWHCLHFWRQTILTENWIKFPNFHQLSRDSPIFYWIESTAIGWGVKQFCWPRARQKALQIGCKFVVTC